jgi:hypothetical protein
MNTLAKALAVVALFSLATAFVPSSTNAPVKSSPTAQYALADRIFGMDLFAPKKDQNDYGARNAKNVKVGKITDKSYIRPVSRKLNTKRSAWMPTRRSRRTTSAT